ncbi:uncharacterized protein LOC129599470 [Paramacrobiotus metropolitanus]|uniref:uncharacterized protein LOC129599470 n=1 Tax=Paramacrobiotus metropolitanus TaxID=2943436 RepID=UPI0024457ED8|nr:uncharacterized protein LOC129599470 [Paramacrobiotus metropolitanus]
MHLDNQIIQIYLSVAFGFDLNLTLIALSFLCSYLSRLITTVWADHLGWVSTVIPSNSQTSHYKLKHEPQWIQLLAKSHPYNPLWAKLGDLLGICGSPARLTKTILVSQNQTLLDAYLHLLCYFVRTSDLAFHRFEPVVPVQPASDTSTQRLRRFQSGDNFRPSSIFKHKHQSGSSRPRLQSLNEMGMGRSKRNPSMSKRNSDAGVGSDDSVFEGN